MTGPADMPDNHLRSMMTSLSSSDRPSDSRNSPLNKKRRFVPNSISVAHGAASLNALDNGFNAPFLVHIYGEIPTQSDVQTQLFQVGMRVRKSVNEGYQTTPKQRIPTRAMAGPRSDAAGLLSYTDNTSAFTTPERRWSCDRRNKRAFVQETDEDSDAADFSPMTPVMPHSDHRVQIPSEYFNINYDFDHMEDDVSPTTVPEDSPSRKGVLMTRVNGRRIAVPRSRRQKDKPITWGRNLFEQFQNITHEPPRLDRHQSSATQWLGHQKPSPERGLQGNDFEEALFLQNREDVDMDCS